MEEFTTQWYMQKLQGQNSTRPSFEARVNVLVVDGAIGKQDGEDIMRVVDLVTANGDLARAEDVYTNHMGITLRRYIHTLFKEVHRK